VSCHNVYNYLILFQIDRFIVPLEYVNDAPEITDDTKLAYLLPSTEGEGICIISLVDFLVKQHNDFIRFCYMNIPQTYYDPES